MGSPSRVVRTLIVTASVLVVAGCHGPATRQEVETATVPGARPDPERWGYVSRLLRGRDISAGEWQRWSKPEMSAGDIADEMLTDPFLSEVVAPAILFRNNVLRRPRQVRVDGYTLSKTEIAGRTVFYLRDKCGPEQVVSVRPWWDLAAPILVCRDSIRATVWEGHTADGTTMPCDSGPVAPTVVKDSPCRCGPNLLRCSLETLTMPIRLGAIDEVRATVAHVAATDAPLADVFSMNATVRSRLIELYYLRSLAESRRLEDPEPLLRTADGWPADGKLAPRQETEEGEHAGVLTAPHIRNQIFDYRQRQRVIFEVMWCAGESAPGALPEDLLSLHTANLSVRNEGWRELAARPNCTHCHARLDYGMQFFRGHTVPTSGPWHYVTGATAGERGPLYGTSIDDPRGEAPLTAQGFARIATRQPEFARCMATNVGEYVFGYAAPPKTIDRIAGSAPPQELRFRGMLRAAVLEFVGCDSCSVPGRELPRAPDAKRKTGTSLAKLVDAHCSHCHYDGAPIISLQGAVDARTRARALDNVLFGRMPPTGPLSSDVRRQFLDAVGASRSASGAYDRSFLSVAANPPRALPLIAARAYIRQVAGHGSAVSDINTLEMALNGRDTLFTPNYAAVTAIEAYRSCESVAAAARTACVERALDGAWNLAPRSGRSGR